MGRTRVLAVVVASIVHFVLGAIWFTLLSEPWLRGIGKTREQMMAAAGGKESPFPYLVSFACTLAIAWTLTFVMEGIGRPSVGLGIRLGALLGVGIVFATTWTEYVFEQRSFAITLITTGYPIVGMMIMGAIIGGWLGKYSDVPKARLASAR